MIYYLTHIRDIAGNNYLGIDIPNAIVDTFLQELKDIMEDDNEFNIYIKNQKNRDHDKYHITTINVIDYNRLSKKMGISGFINSLEPVFKYPIDDLKMLGIGTATKNENRTYFVVCKSEKLDAIRSKYDLPNHDFHITIGFNFKDIFGVSKNVLLKKEGKFLKLLKQEYYKNENWNFIRKIENFDLDNQLEIIPISISNSQIKVKCDGYYMDIVYLDDEKFWIATKYQMSKDLPRLPETEIAKILNKK